jgi:7-cyano-7-deazaguanine synthase
MKKAIVLNSGGLDSATAMAIAKEEGFCLYSLTIDYGQRHKLEIESALKIAEFLKAEEHKCFQLDLSEIAESALTASAEVPKDRDLDNLPDDIPSTYVPARNTVFLSLALAWADVIGASDIFIGVHVHDASGYPDCRIAYLKSFEKTANIGTRMGAQGVHITIHAPLINLTKADIIKRGTDLGIDYSLTHSCYDPSPEGQACGRCDSCLFRKRGFSDAGIPDPTKYVDT